MFSNKGESCCLVGSEDGPRPKVVGSNLTRILDGSGVKATQVLLIHPAWFFLDASNDCWTNRVSGSCLSFTGPYALSSGACQKFDCKEELFRYSESSRQFESAKSRRVLRRAQGEIFLQQVTFWSLIRSLLKI